MNPRWEDTFNVHRDLQRNWGTIRTGMAELGEAFRARSTNNAQRDFLYSLVTGAAVAATEPIYVSEDVCTLWQYAWAKFEPERIRRHDLVIPQGFALLPRAIEIGVPNPCRALLWVSNEEESWAFCLSHKSDAVRNDYLGEWTLETAYAFDFEQGLAEPGSTEKPTLLHQSFWRIMAQVIPVPERLPRARRREEARRGSGRDTVTVLRLRRQERCKSDETIDVEWDHRWLVRGHWRNQWYPSIQEHRQIWISPYVKGPDELPLVVTDRIVEFVR